MAAGPSETQAAAMAKLDEDIRCVLVNTKVPVDIIVRFADLEYTSLGDFVDFFADKDKVKSDGPAELGFAVDTNGYDAKSSK